MKCPTCGEELPLLSKVCPVCKTVVDKEDGKFILTGAGWGHGVGLCQIGAAVMADQGYAYEKILAHYFPGSKLLPIEE